MARILLPVLIVVAACTSAPAATLDGRTFLSTSVTEDGVAWQLVAGTRIRLSFGEGRIGASVGCNSFGAGYRTGDGHLIVTEGGQTLIGCAPDREAQDDWLFAFLGSRPMLSLAGNDLVLESGGTVITLLDREIADPDLPLVGTTWTVSAIISGGADSSAPAGVVASIVFMSDGRVEVNDGCNSGGGQFSATAETLRIVELSMTKRACDRGEAQMEAAVLAVLRAESIDYRIEAGTLSLNAGNRGLALSGR